MGPVLLHTHVHARLLGVQCVCSPCARSAPLYSLSPHAQHTLCKHSTRSLCTPTAGSTHALCQHCRFSLMHSEHTQLLTLCTLIPHAPCTLCVCFVQALHTPSLLTLFAHSPQAVCMSHANAVCMFTPQAPCTGALCTDSLCTLCTLGTHSQCWHAHRGHAGSVDTPHTPHTLCTRSVHLAARSLCVPSMCSTCSLACPVHPLYTLCAHLLHTLVPAPMHPVCTVRVPSCTLHACFLCAVLQRALCMLHAHPPIFSPCNDCMFSLHVCVLSARSLHTRPGEKAIKAMPQEDGGRKRGALGGINRKLVTLRRAE